MSFLKNFLEVGRASDRELLEGASLYYGYGPLTKPEAASVAASSSSADTTITVNVNVDNAGNVDTTEHSSKKPRQYIAERDNDGEYHVVYKKNEPVRSEPKPVSTETPADKPKPEKTPKPAEQAKTTTADSAKPAAKQPQAKPKLRMKLHMEELEHPNQQPVADESAALKASEHAAVSTTAPDTATAHVTKEKPAEQPKKATRVDATEQAAPKSLNGFSVEQFIQQPSAAVPAQPQTVAMPPAPLFPDNYQSLPAFQKANILDGLIGAGYYPKLNDPQPLLDTNKKLLEIQKHIKLMDIPGRQFNGVQLISLLRMLESNKLKSDLKRNESVDRPNNPKLIEVPLSKHATANQLIEFDMVFEVPLKNPKKVMVILCSTVPEFNFATGRWQATFNTFVKDVA